MAYTETIVNIAEDSRWSCPCTMLIDGKNSIEFQTVNSALSATAIVSNYDLLTYSGQKVGTISAYNQKVAASEYNAMSTPVGAVLTNNKKDCGYPNGMAEYDIEEDRLIGKHARYQTIETVSAGNLHFTIQRNYTAVDRDTFYVVTAVNDIGEESAPSEISEMVVTHADEAPTIKFETINDKTISSYRIYRASGGTSGSDFFFVDEVSADTADGGTITFKDIKSTEELNEPLPKFGNVPEKLQGICGMSGGFIAAYKGKDIYFSEPYLPYCFQPEYSQSVPFDIVGMAVRGNYLYVMTEGPLYAFVGDHPETITPLSMRFDVPCISRASIAHVDGSIIYAGTTGLVMINNNGPSVFSDKIYTLEQYKNLGFENCTCSGGYNGKYIAVFENKADDLKNKALVFDFSDGQMNLTELDADAFTAEAYSWANNNWYNYRTYFKAHNTPFGETMITQDFTENSAALTTSWRSKEYVFHRPIAFTTARINYEDKPNATISVKLYGDGKLVYDSAKASPQGIPRGEAFRLPVMRRETHWSVEISGNADITSVEFAESMAEM